MTKSKTKRWNTGRGCHSHKKQGIFRQKDLKARLNEIRAFAHLEKLALSDRVLDYNDGTLNFG
jgi:hypothetical protein